MRIKPSVAVVLVLLGLAAEPTFLAGLREAARNPRTVRNVCIDDAVDVTPLDTPTRIDRARGDIP